MGDMPDTGAMSDHARKEKEMFASKKKAVGELFVVVLVAVLLTLTPLVMLKIGWLNTWSQDQLSWLFGFADAIAGVIAVIAILFLGKDLLDLIYSVRSYKNTRKAQVFRDINSAIDALTKSLERSNDGTSEALRVLRLVMNAIDGKYLSSNTDKINQIFSQRDLDWSVAYTETEGIPSPEYNWKRITLLYDKHKVWLDLALVRSNR